MSRISRFGSVESIDCVEKYKFDLFLKVFVLRGEGDNKNMRSKKQKGRQLRQNKVLFFEVQIQACLFSHTRPQDVRRVEVNFIISHYTVGAQRCAIIIEVKGTYLTHFFSYYISIIYFCVLL